VAYYGDYRELCLIALLTVVFRGVLPYLIWRIILRLDVERELHLALLPIALIFVMRHGPVRKVPVWYGGTPEHAAAVATTALSFSSALRTFYSFIYRPVMRTTHEHEGREYFIRRLVFDQNVAPVFGPTLFEPTIRFVQGLAKRLRALQSGNLNFYLALIGALSIVILVLSVV
jgi:hydrogenase-4 component B